MSTGLAVVLSVMIVCLTVVALFLLAAIQRGREAAAAERMKRLEIEHDSTRPLRTLVGETRTPPGRGKVHGT